MTVGASTANAGTATLDLNGNSLAVTSLSGPALGVITNSSAAAAATLTVGVPASSASTYAGRLINGTQALSLNAAGPGTLVLSGSSTFTGGTTINGGALVLANAGNGSALGGGPVGVIVNGGGVLASDPTVGGTMSGSVTAQSGATLAPGGLTPPVGASLAGALTIGGSLSLANGATLNFDLNATTADPLNITGLLTDGGPSSVNLVFNQLTALAASTYTLATFNAGSTVAPGDFNYTNLNGYVLTLGSSSLMLIGNSGPATWQGGVLSTSWTDSTNWNGSVPSGNGAIAVVGSATATPTTITLDSPQTLGQLTLSATNAATGYTLAAGYAGSLVMSNSNNTAVILVPSGSHSITAPVVLAGALSIQPTAGMTLNILGNISEMTVGGGSLSLDGPGTLILGGSDSYTGGTTLTAGTLVATSSSSLPAGTNLTVGGGSTFIFDPSQAAAPAAGGVATLSAAPASAVAAVPEPDSLVLLGAAGILAAAAAWRRGKGSRS